MPHNTPASFGIYATRAAAEAAVEQLNKEGFKSNKISIVPEMETRHYHGRLQSGDILLSVQSSLTRVLETFALITELSLIPFCFGDHWPFSIYMVTLR